MLKRLMQDSGAAARAKGQIPELLLGVERALANRTARYHESLRNILSDEVCVIGAGLTRLARTANGRARVVAAIERLEAHLRAFRAGAPPPLALRTEEEAAAARRPAEAPRVDDLPSGAAEEAQLRFEVQYFRISCLIVSHR